MGLEKFRPGTPWSRTTQAALEQALRGNLSEAERILVDGGIFGAAVAAGVARSAWSASIALAGEGGGDA